MGMRGREDHLPTDRREAVGALFMVHNRRLLGLASLLVDDAGSAEEIVQDAFESLYRHWGGLRDPQAAAVYLDRAVVNGARSWVRRRVSARSYVFPQAGVEESAEDTSLGSVRHSELSRAIRELPQRQREVIVLRYFLDLTESETANWLGVTTGSVKRHAFRATAALQKRMEAWA